MNLFHSQLYQWRRHMKIPLPSWLARKLHVENNELTIELGGWFDDVPEGLKQFFLFFFLFLIGGYILLAFIAVLTLYS